QRGDVQNLSAAALDHVTAGKLRKAKHAREIYFDYLLPIIFGIINRGRAPNCAGVIDENIELPEVFDRLLNQSRRRFASTQITSHWECLFPNLRYRFASGARRVRVSVTGYVRAGFSQRGRDGLPESGRSARHQSDFAIESERIKDHAAGSGSILAGSS